MNELALFALGFVLPTVGVHQGKSWLDPSKSDQIRVLIFPVASAGSAPPVGQPRAKLAHAASCRFVPDNIGSGGRDTARRPERRVSERAAQERRAGPRRRLFNEVLAFGRRDRRFGLAPPASAARFRKPCLRGSHPQGPAFALSFSHGNIAL